MVVIGFGPVAARLIDELRGEVVAGRLQILVVGAEPQPAYNRILIGEAALGSTDPDLLPLSDPDELRADGITVRLGVAVVGIDRERRYLTLADGDQHVYDLLVFATGAAARVPRLVGLDHRGPGEDPRLPAGMTVLRDLGDADRLAALAAPGRSLIVLGGGVLGMELALAAAEHGARVTLVHSGRVPMERNLDRTAAALVARHLRRHDVGVEADARATGVRIRDGRFVALTLADDRHVGADGIVLCCGAVPRTGLAESAGFPCDNGILVDHRLAVGSEPGVFAIGDCARVRCPDDDCRRCHATRGPSGLVGPGWAQAEQLATHVRALLDHTCTDWTESAERPDDPPVMVVKTPGLSIVSAGQLDLDPADWLADDHGRAGVAQWSDPEHGRYAKMITDDGVLVGLICVGMPRTAAELTLLYERRAELPSDRSALLRHDGPDHGFGGVPGAGTDQTGDDVIVCRCNGVSTGQIAAAIDDGHHDVVAVGKATRAGTGCGSCKDRVCEILDNRTKVGVA